jgi:hypothetical protein
MLSRYINLLLNAHPAFSKDPRCFGKQKRQDTVLVSERRKKVFLVPEDHLGKLERH